MKYKKMFSVLAATLMVLSLTSCSKTAGTAEETASAGKPEAVAESVQDGEDTSYDTTVQYDALVLKDGDALEGGTYTATEEDQSVLEISDGQSATVTRSVLNKEAGGASSANASSFEGVNSAVRVYGGAELTLKDCVITADADDATGVFAYDGGTVYISDSEVTVTGGGAGGVQVAGGGYLYGEDLTVTSRSKAAIRSDRGGGVMELTGGTYTSTGSNGCPAIYSTADITVKDATCVSENSRAVIIEGKNSVTLENCELTGNDQSTKEGSVRANVLLYQSASGDASEGTSEFSMKNSRMVCLSGAMFYCTNTSSEVDIESSELVLSEDGTLLIVSAGRWGKDGKNGGRCSFSSSDQELAGGLLVDEISSLELELSSSSFTGYIESDGETYVTLSEGSTWTLTGDSSISGFTGDTAAIDLNGYTLYVDGEPLV